MQLQLSTPLLSFTLGKAATLGVRLQLSLCP